MIPMMFPILPTKESRKTTQQKNIFHTLDPGKYISMSLLEPCGEPVNSFRESVGHLSIEPVVQQTKKVHSV